VVLPAYVAADAGDDLTVSGVLRVVKRGDTYGCSLGFVSDWVDTKVKEDCLTSSQAGVAV
jgi:phage head maturation protease